MTTTNRVLHELRSQALGLVALALVLSTGTAYAVAARNSVVSTSIKNGEVRSADVAAKAADARRLATGSVGPDQVADGSIGSADLGDGSVLAADLAPLAVGPADVTGISGADFAPGSLGGAYLDESSFGRVPTSDQGGRGRYDLDGSCDPESSAFVPCASITLPVAAFGRILLVAQVRGSTESGSDSMIGTCRLEVNGSVVPGSSTLFDDNDSGGSSTVVSTAPLVGVSGVTAPGSVLVAAVCSQGASGAITYPHVILSAVVLSGA